MTGRDRSQAPDARSTGSGVPDAGPELLVVVGAGGVGKTTLAAALAAARSRRGEDTLVMTFDPSLRLRQVQIGRAHV